MNDKELNALVGLSITAAEEVVRAAGLKPRTFHVDAVRTMACLPRNVVELNHDDNDVVVSANTQKSIDAKYAH